MLWLAVLLTISIDVYPQASISGEMRVTVRIPRHEDNRAYYIEWGCDGIAEGSTGKTMDGTNEKAIFQFNIDPIGGEDCAVVGILTRVEDGKVKYYKAREEFIRRPRP